MNEVKVADFGQIIADHAAVRPEASALSFVDRRWRYADLDTHANRVARMLGRCGARPGDRIAWLAHNSDVAILTALAAARAGLIFVPVNWRLAPAEITAILADAEPRILVLGEGFDAPNDNMTIFEEQAILGCDDPAHPIDHSIDSAQTVALFYTSGTTGMPKGVMLSHRSLFGTSTLRQRQRVEWDDWSEKDVTLVPMPLAHIGGFGMVARTLFFGGEAVIQRGFEPEAVLDAIEHQRISKLGLVPTAIRMLIDHPRARAINYDRIRTIVYGAAPITPDLLRQAIAVFGCDFAQSYGMTETSATCVALPPGDHDVNGTPRMQSAGRALPGTKLRVLDDAGGVLPPGEVGEIAIRCISVMNGYWRQPEETSRVLGADGWYRTGDAGYLDPDGYLFVKDRIKDMIISGGENIYPAEIENVLTDHPDISEVAVIGVPDPLWGESVAAFVVPLAGVALGKAALLAWCRSRLAGYKVPRTVHYVEQLPKGPSGKILKHVLKAQTSIQASATRGTAAR